ncbi:hypothetical protein BCR42DRAFT_423050 [Absidia repens]|uniref:Uncharacterized protein n=1 Tax=Absidia repens TaxID=90262 RepID=A0A1X2I690_9FUNG|nr:hypothetical protein BCR42DRAFT_423050 [Absidia repens]
MTDVIKAVVKLPPKNRQSIALKNNHDDYPPPQQQKPKESLQYDSYLVSDWLYMQVPSAIGEYDILDLLQTCHPQDIHLTEQPFPELSSGYMTFPTKDHADLAFTLFNGANFSNGMRLSLYMNPLTSEGDPEPTADILQVQNLPPNSTNKSLYDLFRPFGPMSLCKVVVEQGTVDFHGAALIQYYHANNADHAVSFMNNRRIQENIITLFPLVSSKRQQSNPEVDSQHGNHVKPGSDPNPVDYTNLYIKNLDLNAKSSDLFKHFRKFGHIISARVMKNARTNQSKGFGFVSFINAEEANRALHGMNGRFILSKTVQVAFHEPKKSRNEKSGGGDTDQQQQDGNDNGNSHFGRTPPSNTIDIRNSTPTHLSHMAAPYSPPTPQTNYSLQSPVPQQHHRSHLHQTQQQQQQQQQQHQNQSTHQYQSAHQHYQSPAYQQQQQLQSNQQYHSQHILNEDSTPYRSLASKKSQTFSKNGQQPLSLGNGSVSELNTTSSHHSPRTNDHNGNVYPATSNSKKGTMDYDHSYLNYSATRKQQLGIFNSNSTTPHSLSTLASGASIQAPPPPMGHHQSPSSSLSTTATTTTTTSYKTTAARKGPTMRRRGSIESICSVMTETSTNTQRQRLTNAILQCGDETVDQIDDIVDMLLTLKKRERSLCLFNPDFLKSKVQQAKNALETFDEDEDDDDDDVDNNYEPATAATVQLPPPPPPPSSSQTSGNQVTLSKTSNNNKKTANDSSSSHDGNRGSFGKHTCHPSPAPSTKEENMDAFLTSLDGMVMHEKKQKLGDRLFPLVKATGVKHAPKITIRLLDTIPLHELAHLMHMESSLRTKIDQVMTGELHLTS